jgi:DNA-directed RNA polymerase subunit K/omega
MAYPNISELNSKAENKYALTSLIAKRTRDIMSGLPILTNLDTDLPMFAAEDEVYMDYIDYRKPGSAPIDAIDTQRNADEGEAAEALSSNGSEEGAKPEAEA